MVWSGMTFHIGFTGTQSGMTTIQSERVAQILDRLPMTAAQFHHGDCIGADEQADGLAHIAGYTIHLHVPSNPTRRANCEVREDRDTLHPPKPYLDRNRDIVDACDAVIAAPKEMTETLRSGTWSTVRYARAPCQGLTEGRGIQGCERTAPRSRETAPLLPVLIFLAGAVNGLGAGAGWKHAAKENGPQG